MTPDPKEKKENTDIPTEKIESQTSDNKTLLTQTARELKEPNPKSITDKSLKQQEEAAEETASSLNYFPPNKLNTRYNKLHETFKNKTPEDRQKFQTSKIEDIRFNSRLLTSTEKKKTNEEIKNSLREETSRRISIYTDQETNGWKKLDYTRVSQEHEYEIGLGDILLDPNITNIEIEQKGKIIIGKRGTASNGRQAFLDKNGQYIATFTGDRFRIIKGATNIPNETQTPNKYNEWFVKEYKKEETQRQKYKSSYEKERKWLNTKTKDMRTEILANKNFTTDEFVINTLNQKGYEGEKILNYSKQCCNQFNIPFPILKELIQIESGWNPNAKNKHSTATGLGQFIDNTWGDFIKYANSTNIPLLQGHKLNRRDPYTMLYATAWLMHKTKENFPNLDQKPIEEQGVIYYLAHHEGVNGAKIALTNIKTRLNNRTFRQVYTFAKRIGIKAARSDSNYIKKLKETIDTTYNKLEWNTDRNSKATNKLPYRYHESNINGTTISSSGRPGRGGRGASAEKQIINIWKNKKKEELVFLNLTRKGQYIPKMIKSLNKQGLTGVNMFLGNGFPAQKTHAIENFYKDNKGKQIAINCENGAHRAPAVHVILLILNEGNKHTFGEYLRLADCQAKKYQKYRKIFKDLVKYALSKGIRVEAEYLHFAGLEQN